MLLSVKGIPTDTPSPKTALNRLRAPPSTRTKMKLPQPEAQPRPGRLRLQPRLSASIGRNYPNRGLAKERVNRAVEPDELSRKPKRRELRRIQVLKSHL